MSGLAARPPAIAARVLEWAARRLGTPELAADAAELYEERVLRHGEASARRWYRRQAFAALKPLLMVGGHAGGYAGNRLNRGRSGGGDAGVSLLDFRIGLRMLVRYPGLTVVAGVAMAFAIAVGAGTFEFMRDVMYPRLPLADGDRVVRFQDWDTRAARRTGIAPAEFRAWRDALKTVENVGAFYGVARNLWSGEGGAVPVDGVVVSASAFDVARTRPLLGRRLVAADEAAASTPVVVLGHDLWRGRFGSDPAIAGRVVRLGDEQVTVVGVMPAGYAFPVPADIYIPLRLDELAARAAGGEPAPGLTGFGRLRRGETLTRAQSELTGLGARSASAATEAREQLAPMLEPFAYPLVTTSGILTNVLFAVLAFFLTMLMVVVCANVALLLFARAATREGEILVRTALGASRGRIISQLFVEALVLAGVAIVAGLWAASLGLKWVMALASAQPNGGFPFWVGDTLSPATVGWAILLALVGAAVAGVIPALQITGRDVHGGLQHQAGRGSGVRLGGVWTGIVTGQVALTVIFLPIVLAMGSVFWVVRSADRSVAAEQYLSVRLEAGSDALRFDSAQRELRNRLLAEPWVSGVAVADGVWPAWLRSRPLEVDGVPASAGNGADRTSQHLSVDPGFFDVMGARFVAGRSFVAGDVEAGRRAVVVNESFVEHVLGGRNAVGRQIRIGDLTRPATVGPMDEATPWYEIIGVVADLGLNPYADLPHRGVIFHPLSMEGVTRLSLTVHIAGTPADYANHVRALALQIDPTLRIQTPRTLEHVMDRPAVEYAAMFRVALAAGAITLLLTLAGIYAVVSYTVSRRTREIGVRVALGARPRQVAAAVFSRPATHVGFGVLAGGIVIPLLMLAMSRLIQPGPEWPPLLLTVALLMAYLTTIMAACVLACLVPLRRALSVQPTVALAGDA